MGRLFPVFFSLFSSLVLAADPPVGFQDPALLAKVMSGKADVFEKVSSSKEFETIVRLFIDRATPEAYAKVATNHAAYPSIFTEVKQGKTLQANSQLTEFDYWLDMLVIYSGFTEHIYPEGHQTVLFGVDVRSETTIDHHLKNYEETIAASSQHTRLIPWETGILVEDDTHIVMVEASMTSAIVKKKLHDFFASYAINLQKALN